MKKLWPIIGNYSLSFCVGLLLLLSLFITIPVKAFNETDLRFYHRFENNLFDEIASTTDLNEYAASGNITYVTGQFDDAIKITSTGGSGNFLRAEGAEITPYALTNGDPFSISQWVKGGALIDYQGLMYGAANINNGVRSNGSIYFYFDNGTVGRTYTCTGTSIDNGSWHNVIFTGQIGSLSTTMKIYFDGTLLTSCSWDNIASIDDNVGDETPAQIDFFHVTSSGNVSIDDFAGFSIILTQDEIDDIQTSSIDDLLTPVVTENSLIYAFGYPDMWSNPTVFERNQTKYFNIFWDVCDDYGNVDSVRLRANLNGAGYDPGIYVIKPKSEFIGAQECKGSIPLFHDNYTNNDTTSAGTAIFTLSEYSATNSPNSYISSTPVIKTLTSNTITYTSDTSTNWVVSSMPNPLMIDLGNLPQGVHTETSTKLMFFYNFTGLNVASSSVCLWDYRTSTSTGYCNSDALSATTTFGMIVIPTPEINTNNSYRFYTVSPNFSTLQSSLFSVNWSFTPLGKPGCSIPERDISHACDFLGAPDIIGTSTFDYSAWYDHTLCAATRAAIKTVDFFIRPNCSALDFFQSSYDNFKETPPFNIFYQFTDTIETAISSTTATTSATLGIPWVRNTDATNTIYMLPVISSSSLSNAIGSSNVSMIRLTLGWIFWIFGALIAILMIWKL